MGTLTIFLAGAALIPFALKGRWYAILALGLCWGLGLASLMLDLVGK